MIKFWGTRKYRKPDTEPESDAKCYGNTAELNRSVGEAFARNLIKGIEKILEESEQAKNPFEDPQINNPAQNNAP